jgi:4-diphosphocytidyl-2-C-methyl-D-erythritol kinase
MIDFAPCKINLGLEVVSKRNDGYHNIQSVMYPVPLFDILEVVSHAENEFLYSQTGFKVDCSLEQNLLFKVWNRINQRFNIGGIKVHLHKQIPTGAGLGGGSSNAATMLKVLNKMFALNLDTLQMEILMADFGSDCPFFIQNKAAFVFETGTLMEALDLDLSRFFIHLIKPKFSISTALAYSKMKVEDPVINLRSLPYLPKDQWQKQLRNRFEEYAFNEFHELEQIRDYLQETGAVYAAMSGSGSTIFGIFEHKPEYISKYSSHFQWIGKLD